jgi:glycolate oxidase iron-sulfur subunit
MNLFSLGERAKAAVDTCVHCGLCLEACPTYRELGIEDDSPRGRIHLIRNMDLGVIQPTPKVIEHLDLCLGCRACESACPSGVQYGAIIEDARAKLEAGRQRGFWERSLRSLFFRGLFPHPSRLRALARTIRLTQRLKLDRFAAASGLMKLMPRPVAAMADVSVIPDTFGRDALPEFVPARGESRYTVAFITGCVMDVMFGPTNIASVRVLAANGCDVHIPRAQTCCGALQLHGGDEATAVALAMRNIDTFLATGAEYIIINAAGCGSTLKEYHHLLHGTAYQEKARDFVGRVRDISEFLAAIDLVPPTHAVPAVATYQDACHLAHGQGVRMAPRKLLAQVPGLTLVPLPDADACCGSAGIYNLVEYDMSMDVLKRKMENVASTRAAVVVSANPGCIMQLRLGAKQRGLNIEILHIIDVLDRAYGPEPGKGG